MGESRLSTRDSAGPGDGRSVQMRRSTTAHRWRARWMLGLVLIGLAVVAVPGATARPAQAFGSYQGTLSQRSEHEMITRWALACPPDHHSTGDCFEPESIAQLAGTRWHLGAVGSPDYNEVTVPAAHCD